MKRVLFIINFFHHGKLNSLCDEIVNKKIISCEKNNLNLVQGEDALYNYEIYTNAKKILFISNCFYHYTENPNSTSNNLNSTRILKSIDDIFILYEEKLKYLKKWNMDNEKNRKIVANRLLNFLTGQFFRFYRVKNISKNAIEDIYSHVYSNETYNKITKSITVKDIEKSNYLFFIHKKNLLNKNVKGNYKFIRIIKIYYKLRMK